MKRRNAIKKMIVSIAGLFGLSTAVKATNKACLKVRKTPTGEARYYIEFPIGQYDNATALIRSLSNDLYTGKIKFYLTRFYPEGHCVIEWSYV